MQRGVHLLITSWENWNLSSIFVKRHWICFYTILFGHAQFILVGKEEICMDDWRNQPFEGYRTFHHIIAIFTFTVTQSLPISTFNIHWTWKTRKEENSTFMFQYIFSIQDKQINKKFKSCQWEEENATILLVQNFFCFR